LDAANATLKSHLSIKDTTDKSDSSKLLNNAPENNPLLGANTSKPDSGAVASKDSNALNGDSLTAPSPAASKEEAAKENPLNAVLQPSVYRDESDKYNLATGPVIG